MKFTCIGILERKGEYDGRPYHSYQLYCTGLYTGQGSLWGAYVETVKVNAAVMHHAVRDPSELIDREIQIVYDRYGRVADIRLD